MHNPFYFTLPRKAKMAYNFKLAPSRKKKRREKGMKRLTIAEVSERFGTSPDTLRYYERVGLIPPVGRKGGMRNYDESDIKWIEFILCMRSAGVPIEELVRYVALYREGSKTTAERKNILVAQRERLLSRIEELETLADKLGYKIANYETEFLEKEKQLLGERP